MSNKPGSGAFEQNYAISPSTPSDTDVKVGVLWTDPDDGKVYRCTSLGPIVFTEITGAAPADVDYLVGQASGSLSAEIVVGTSPGGELGGTWASPTVDATHSGSSHANLPSGAEVNSVDIVTVVTPDDTVVALGTNSDIASLNRSTALAADTALTGVLVGTDVGSRQALAANSLIISNITTNGDIGLYATRASVSYEALFVDASASQVYIGMGQIGAPSRVMIEHRDSTSPGSEASLTLRVTNTTADPYLSLQTAATQWYWAVDNSDSDIFKIGTGTVVGTSTFLSITTAGIIASTGALDFGAATSFEIPNGAGGTTVDAAGEVCIDTTSKTLNFYDGAAEVVLNPIQSKSFVIETPVATDDLPIWRTDVAITLVEIHYLCIGGTNWIGQLQECDANGINGADVQQADTTATATDTEVTSFSNAGIDAGDYIGIKTTSISGTPTLLVVTFNYVQVA